MQRTSTQEVLERKVADKEKHNKRRKRMEKEKEEEQVEEKLNDEKEEMGEGGGEEGKKRREKWRGARADGVSKETEKLMNCQRSVGRDERVGKIARRVNPFDAFDFV